MLATKAEAEILLPDLSEKDVGAACADVEDGADALAPARGIVLGALLGLFCIGALALVVWRAF